MQNHTLVALGVSMFALMVVSFYLTVRAYRKKQKPKEQRDDVTLHVRLGGGYQPTTDDTNPEPPRYLRESFQDLRTDLTATQAERDNFKALWEQARKEREQQIKFRQEADANVLELRMHLETAVKLRDEWRQSCIENQQERDEWKERAERWNKEREEWAIAHTKVMSEKHEWVKKCDEARALANDLREYLDRALKIVKEQNEQLYKLSGAWRHNQRNADGTFRKKEFSIGTPVKTDLPAGQYWDEKNQRWEPVPPKPESVIPAETVKEGDTLHVQMIQRAVKKTRAIGITEPLNVTQTPKVVDEHGNDLRKQPRPISSLKPTEAIQVNSDAELSGVQKLMEAEGLVWLNGTPPFEFTPNRFPNWIGLSDGRVVHWCRDRETILPASDFLPAEQPKPIELRRDHPCLKGCSKPDACFCPPGLPRNGRVQFIHPRSFFVEKGILEGEEHSAGDYKKLEEWANTFGGTCRTLTSHNRYIFTRPAVNSDFDVPNTTQP